MNNDLLLLIKKHTDTLIEQTKTKPKETLEFKMNKQMEAFAFSLLINLSEEGNWLLSVTSFEATNFVFKTTITVNKKNSFLITTPGHWNSKPAGKTFDDLFKLLELRSQNDIELHVEQGKKRDNFIK